MSKSCARILCLATLLFSIASPAFLVAQDFRKQVIYQVITDRFFDGDPANNDPPQSKGLFDPTKTNWQAYWGGDLAGIQAKLAYIKGMGASAIWISPPVDNENLKWAAPDGKPLSYLFAPYHGYAARDFQRIDEHIGSSANDWKAFDDFVAASHALGIKIIVDFSPNDTNLIDTGEHGAIYDNGKFLGTYADDKAALYHHYGTLTDWNNPFQLQYYNVFGLTDLNEDNPIVDDYIKRSITQFQDHGVDAFRIDAVKHITWGWVYSLANTVHTHKSAFVFAEWFLDGFGDKFYSDACKFSNRSGISLLDYPLAIATRSVFAENKSFAEIDHALTAENKSIRDPNDMVTFFDNHDIPRLLSLHNNQNRLNEATAFILMARGIPIVYYGDEQYLHNDTDRGRDPYTRVWMSSYDTDTVGYKLVKKLADLRRSNDALGYGAMQTRSVSPDTFVFERKFANHVVLVAINKSEDKEAEVPGFSTALPAGTYADYLGGLMNGTTMTVDREDSHSLPGRNVRSIKLSPHSVSVWQVARPAIKPEIGSIEPVIGQPGTLVTLSGERLGAKSGTVFVNGVRAHIESWQDTQVIFHVPETASGNSEIQLKDAAKMRAVRVPFTMLEAKLIPVTFSVKNATPLAQGESLYLTGETFGLGKWSNSKDAAAGPLLCPSAEKCLLDVSVPAGRRVQFKLLKMSQDGVMTPESGPIHSYVVPSTGTGSVQIEWQY